MRRAEVVALGLIQGPAELLPVSSSGHVAALPVLLGWEHAALEGARRKEVEVALHAGGAVGLLIGLRRELMALPLDVAVLSMVPTVALAFAAEHWIEERLGGPASLAGGLVAGSVALVLADRRPGQRLEEDAGPRDGVLLGLAQACALVPGVSRAGATLAAARALGFARPDAVRLSRGIGVPVIAGAAVLKGVRLLQRRPGARELATLGAGALSAAAATLAAMPLARVLERDRPLAPWAAYRCVARGRPARARESRAMSGAYAHSGVDTSAADRGVAALVAVLKTIDTGRASRSVLASGHYAAVLEVAPNLGIAVGTDGVGSKLIVAEQTGRYDTVGIDCVAMNVNDVVCVGAEPIALLDYLAVERVDPDVMEAIAVGLKAGAEAAGVEIPGGEVAVLPELIKGHPSPSGFDLTAACFGTVALDRIVTGATCEPGDALIGLPSSGLHSNGYSLARAALGALAFDDRPERCSAGRRWPTRCSSRP